MAKSTKRRPLMRPATVMRKVTWDGKPRRSIKETKSK